MKKGHTTTQAPADHERAWTQMSLNCLMNCGPFSSDQMLDTLNKRIFNLEEVAIVKKMANDNFNPYNGIGLDMGF